MFVTPLLLAVTTLVQDTVPPAPRAPTLKRQRATAIAPVVVSVDAIEAAATALVASTAQLDMLTIQAPVLAASALQVQAIALPALDVVPVIDLVPAIDAWPAESWDPQDPADSLYRAGRRALNRNRYQEAIDLLGQVISRYPRSAYAGEALYYESYALYRTGDEKNLQRAVDLLKQMRDKYPNAAMGGDAETLAARVDGELARRGDAAAAARNQARADSAGGPDATPATPRAPRPPREARPPRPPRSRSSGCDDEDDMRIAALNAVLQMDAERAVPLLKTVLARRDEGSECLRRKAVFLVSQKRSPETAAILLDAVRNDPDQEVREQGVFWLSQVSGDEAVSALDSILRVSTDRNVQDKAIFALSQHRSERAGAILRGFVERRDAPQELREQAIFWLGQHKGAENQAFLRNLFPRLDNQDLKEKVLFAVSQSRDSDNARWLLDVALNERESIEIRKKALFSAGQSRGAPTADFAALYDRVQDREIKNQLILVFSQRSRDPVAMDKLFAIAKNDPDRELRKSAIFWIGQSRDPRAVQFLQDLINQ
jgi:tetratricopeptide (TPR) repeat protein